MNQFNLHIAYTKNSVWNRVYNQDNFIGQFVYLTTPKRIDNVDCYYFAEFVNGTQIFCTDFFEIEAFFYNSWLLFNATYQCV